MQHMGNVWILMIATVLLLGCAASSGATEDTGDTSVRTPAFSKVDRVAAYVGFNQPDAAEPQAVFLVDAAGAVSRITPWAQQWGARLSRGRSGRGPSSTAKPFGSAARKLRRKSWSRQIVAPCSISPTRPRARGLSTFNRAIPRRSIMWM